MACFKAQFNHDFPLFNGMKQQRLLDSALSQTPFELRSFLPFNALFIPNRGKETHLSLGPQPIYFFSLTPPRGTERHCSLCRFATDLFSFNVTPWHRATPLSRSATDVIFFPNATAWHSDATILALNQNVISSFLSYNHHLIGKESSVEISRHQVAHWAMLPNSSLKPGSSFRKITSPGDTKTQKLKILSSRSSTKMNNCSNI